MAQNLTRKILENHLISGNMNVGEEICIKIDQTLTQDTTGTMAYLELEAMKIDKVKTEVSVAYIDHNLLQTGYENADDHNFIKSAALKHGIIYSKPGNGICHQIHTERFAKPNKTLIGSDSHTPTSGAMGMIAIGAGGLDVAVGMAKGLYFIKMPKVLNVELTGKLNKGVASKDIILHIIKQLTVKGGVDRVIEYSGDGVKTLSLTERATITNMGAELGATTSIFPSDENTKLFLEKQGRGEDYMPLSADDGCDYDEKITIDLATITPKVAYPHSPDNVKEVSENQIKIDQVAIGSCTNSSYVDLMQVAKILEGQKVHRDVDLVISPGSSNIITMLANNGALATFIKAGARILEAGCGPCIGIGQSPKTNGVSLRTINRNFKGRCGTTSADVYLVSPTVAAYSALKGYLADPSELDVDLDIELPEKFEVSNSYFINALSDEERKTVDYVKGPNISIFPNLESPITNIDDKVVLKTGDNITTDDIVPSSVDLIKFRSNIPELTKYCFNTIIPDFKARCDENNGGVIIGGDNYGQGSSREHAALVPLYMGVKAVVSKSFARIHKANLVNAGILPFVFENKDDYEKVSELDNVKIDFNYETLTGVLKVNGNEIALRLEVSDREVDILRNGGYLNYAMSLGVN